MATEAVATARSKARLKFSAARKEFATEGGVYQALSPILEVEENQLVSPSTPAFC